MKIDVFGRKLPFIPKSVFLRIFSNFSIEAEKLIFPTKWVVLVPRRLRKSLLILKYSLSILEICEVAFIGIPLKKLVQELLQDINFNSKEFGSSSLLPKQPILVL